jgi:hypothetical protein
VTQLLTCRRCEHQGYDVSSRIVEVPDPQPIQYSGLEHTVPERFRREARCIDREACDDRAAALERA